MLHKHSLSTFLLSLSLTLPCVNVSAQEVDHAIWNKWVKIAGLNDQISSLIVRYRSLSDAEQQAAIETTLKDIRDAKKSLTFNEDDTDLQKTLAKEQVILSILTHRVPQAVMGQGDPSTSRDMIEQSSWSKLLTLAKWDQRPEFIRSLSIELQQKSSKEKKSLAQQKKTHLQELSQSILNETNKKKKNILKKEMARDKIEILILEGQSPTSMPRKTKSIIRKKLKNKS